jgi:hypothetical protein
VEFLQHEVARVEEQRRTAAAGGGNGGRTAAVAEQRTEQRQRRRRKGIPRGLVCNFRKLQGPPGKEEFNHYSRAQTKM